MLLDVYETGYESVAIWNIFQQEDKKDELTKLVKLQPENDSFYYNTVYNYFLNLLNEAKTQGAPYTEVVSTQAIGLPALCDAVKEYNRMHGTTLMIHQYLTDLPTTGACHYFGPLSKLNRDQQKNMVLYAVGICPEVIDSCFETVPFFNAIYSIDPKQNPMVRQGFFDTTTDNSDKLNSEVSLQLNGMPEIIIQPNELIASIMLGSQASTDTVHYILDLIDCGMNKIFVFGGKNAVIRENIESLIAEDPTLKDHIILLGNQDDYAMASLMTRSNLLIIRGGGLSIMEQLAMNHPNKQVILIHHANQDLEEGEHETCLQAGIPWEDGNTLMFMFMFRFRFLLNNVIVEKTCPAIVYKQIQRLMNKEDNSPDRTESRWCMVSSMSP